MPARACLQKISHSQTILQGIKPMDHYALLFFFCVCVCTFNCLIETPTKLGLLRFAGAQILTLTILVTRNLFVPTTLGHLLPLWSRSLGDRVIRHPRPPAGLLKFDSSWCSLRDNYTINKSGLSGRAFHKRIIACALGPPGKKGTCQDVANLSL